jgi:hypothetical protein
MKLGKELTPEFRKKFVMKIGGSKGKDAVLYNGLLALAHEDERFGHVRAYVTVYPTAENKFTCFARAEIYDKKGSMIGMEEADANANNCGKMTAASFPRMALTRAKGRAFRDFLNVDMVTMEEVQVYEPERATSKQIGKIKALGKELKLKKERLYDLMYDTTGAEEFNELTEIDADMMITELQRKQEKALAKAKKSVSGDPEQQFEFDDED